MQADEGRWWGHDASLAGAGVQGLWGLMEQLRLQTSCIR